MKAKNIKRAGWVTGCLLALLIFTVVCAVSWIFTCGVIKLITMCFGWAFSWSIATGIWLIMFLARTVLNHTVNVKK